MSAFIALELVVLLLSSVFGKGDDGIDGWSVSVAAACVQFIAAGVLFVVCIYVLSLNSLLSTSEICCKVTRIDKTAAIVLRTLKICGSIDPN